MASRVFPRSLFVFMGHWWDICLQTITGIRQLQVLSDLAGELITSSDHAVVPGADHFLAFQSGKMGIPHQVGHPIEVGHLFRDIDDRVDMSDPVDKSAAQFIRDFQSDANIRLLYDSLKDHPKVRWKKSLLQVLGI